MKRTLAANSGAPRDILLVDDNCHGLVARKTLLQELGYNVSTACSGAEALALFEGTNFDLVITDYRMPAMDGVELIRRIRGRVPDTLIILLSGFVDPLGLDEQGTGADLVISKNSNEVNNLVRSVKRLLGRAQPHRKPAASQRAVVRRHAQSSS